MATASPTPMGSYSSLGRMRSHSNVRQRRDSPLSVLGQSQGFSANAPMMQNIDIGDSSDDEIPQPMKLSALTTALLAQNEANSPERIRKPKVRVSRSGSGTPVHDSVTPAPSLRIKRVPLRGAPMRRMRRTPQSEDEKHAASQDQENLVPMSVVKPDHKDAVDSVMKIPDSIMKTADHDVQPPRQPLSPIQRPRQPLSPIQRQERPVPLQTISANTPRRPAPPPPPKMSALETATASAGAATTKTRERKKRSLVTIHNKSYQLMDRIGKGGSSVVMRVMAENYKLLALKRVKLDDADEAAVIGYKGEIDLLEKLKNVERVVKLYDWELDNDRQILHVLLELGESDLARIMRLKNDAADATLDLSFTRYYWREMLSCVDAVHDHDIVHSDLKPANFVLVQGSLKLIDFGIANAIETDHTINVHRDAHIGTPNYMSPESLEDSAGGARGKLANGEGTKDMKLGKPSDVWSLGCILYQMVYGQCPFAHIPNQMGRVLAIVNRNHEIKFPDLGIGKVEVPPGLKRTMRLCLDRDPERRPTIKQLLGGEDMFIYPENAGLPISQELLGRIVRKVAERCMDGGKEAISDHEIDRQYPENFYAKLRLMLEYAEFGGGGD